MHDFQATWATSPTTTKTATYRIHVPPAIDVPRIRGVVFLYPGSGGDWRFRVNDTVWQEAARSLGFALIGAGSPLLFADRTHTRTTVWNSTMAFSVGGGWDGLLDEVRLSKARLSADQLLINQVYVSPPASFEEWALARFGAEAAPGDLLPLADSDGDGIPNLIEYATASDPASAASGNMPQIERVASEEGRRLRLVFRRIADPSLVYTVQAASDPGDVWSPIWTSTGDQNAEGEIIVSDNQLLAAPGARFLRLRVSR